MAPLNRRRFTALLGATLAMPALARAQGSPRSVTVASLLGEDKPETQVWTLIRDRVEARLPGRFRFRIVPNAALGGEREVAEGVRLGSIQASLATLSAMSGWVPETQALDLPFLFADAAHLSRALAGPVGADLRERLAAANFVAPAYINYGARHLLAKEPITHVEQLRGLRIRVIQSPLHTALWTAYGAQPAAIPIPETYNALSTGVVDAMDLTKSAYAGFRLYEVVPQVTETAHIWAAGILYFSAPFWNGLAAEEQEVFAEASREGARFFDEAIRADEERSMAEASAAGAMLHAPENREEWARIAQSIWPDFAEAVGGMERIEALRDA